MTWIQIPHQFINSWKCMGAYFVLPKSKVQGGNIGPTWVPSAPDGPRVGPMNLVIRAVATDALVLKQKAFNMHSADQILIVLDQFNIEILQLFGMLKNNISLKKTQVFKSLSDMSSASWNHNLLVSNCFCNSLSKTTNRYQDTALLGLVRGIYQWDPPKRASKVKTTSMWWSHLESPMKISRRYHGSPWSPFYESDSLWRELWHIDFSCQPYHHWHVCLWQMMLSLKWRDVNRNKSFKVVVTESFLHTTIVTSLNNNFLWL